MWQPIETAPIDGTSILLFVKNMGVVEARFAPGEWTEHHEYGREYTGAAWVLLDDAAPAIEVEEGSVEEGWMHHGNATHWMPLPAAPATETNG